MSNKKFKKPYLIGITGGTASGKTFVIEALKERFYGKIAFISQDQYYKSTVVERLSRWERANFDKPSAFNNNLLILHLKKLFKGKSIKAPVYDYAKHITLKTFQPISPKKVIILEGIMIFQNKNLRKMMDLKIFLEADPDIRLGRRLLRDIEERGISVSHLKEAIEWYMNVVKPMYDKYISPVKKYADFIFNTNKGSIKAAEEIGEIIEKKLRA